MATYVHQDEYAYSYNIYIKLSGDRGASLACLRQHIPTALQKLQLGKDKQRFDVLSIGAGDGFVDQEILKIVKERYLNADNQLQEVEILNTAVEPHPVYVEHYKESIESRAKPHVSSKERSVQFDLKLMSYDEYVDSEHEKKQYDVIHAIHSLYYVDCLESALNHCYYNELGDKGLIVCFLAHHSHTNLTIASVLNKYRSEDKKMHFRSSDMAARLAEKNKWNFESIVLPYKIDVTDIFDENSEDGNCLLDFLTFEVNFRKTGDKVVVEEVMKVLKDMTTTDGNGRMLVDGANGLVLIYKTP